MFSARTLTNRNTAAHGSCCSRCRQLAARSFWYNHYYELQNVSTERYVNILGNHENGTVKNRERVRSSM